MTGRIALALLAAAIACACAPGASGSLAQSSVDCPGGGDFNAFLRAFAADSRVRARHTAATVRVTDWVDASAIDPVEETRNVPRQEYRGFSLAFVDGAFRHLDADGAPWGDPVVPVVQARDSAMLVRYVIGTSEGNSWLFERSDGCWQLAADPEPTWE